MKARLPAIFSRIIPPAIALALLNLLLLLVKGSYPIPFTHSIMKEPATAVWILLVLSLAYQVLSHSRSQRPWTRPQVNRLLFLVIWLFFLSNFRWRGSGDVTAAGLEPFALLRQGNLYLDAYREDFLKDEGVYWVYHRDGHLISMYGSGPGLLLTPVYLLPALAGVPVTNLLVHQLSKLGASLMVALSAYVVLLTLQLLVDAPWATLLTVAYAFGTSSLSTSSQAIWQHGPSQLFLSIGVYLLIRMTRESVAERRRFWKVVGMAGFAFGMAAWCRYTNILVFGCVAIFLMVKYRHAIVYLLAGSFFPGIAILADNYFHSGNILKSGYQPQALQFTLHWLPGFIGLLFSPARGLFLFSPFLLFSVWGFVLAWMKKGSAILRTLGISCLSVLIFYSTYVAWCGGWCFGTRYLADISPILLLGIVPVLDPVIRTFWLRRAFLLSIFYSILVHVCGAFFSWDWEAVPPKLWSVWNHPIPFLMRALWERHARDMPEGGFVLIALAVMGIWFVWPTRRIYVSFIK